MAVRDPADWTVPEPRPSRALVRAKVVVVLGVVFTLLGIGWTGREGVGWWRSSRIQAGPHVLATITGLGPAAHHRQLVTLSYHDRDGNSHSLQVRFPLGLGDRTTLGSQTTVAYQAGHPTRAELAYHPRVTWQLVALGAAITASLTGVWVGTVARLAARETGASSKSTRNAHVALAAGLLYGIGRLGIRLVAAHPAQLVNFAPLPPPLPASAAHRVVVPAAATAPPSAVGPVVTPALAEDVVAALWPLRDQAMATRDATTLRAVETGPALSYDLARLDQGIPVDRLHPEGEPVPFHQVYVPRQQGWPASFMVELATTSAARPWLELMIFQRGGPTASWRVAYDTGYAPANGTARPDPPSVTANGFDGVVPVAWTAPARAVGDLAAYWQHWADTGAGPRDGPKFAPGTWTSRFVHTVAGSQGRRSFNGLRRRVRFESAPDQPVWTFGVYNGVFDMVCSPLFQTSTWAGPAHQDEHRQKWGRQLAPGVYRSVTSVFLRQPCVLVPASPGPLVVFGADDMTIETTGVRR